MTVLSYELAKELKDAGWPQPQRWTVPGFWYGPGGRDLPGVYDVGSPPDKSLCAYAATLDELIEACPPELYVKDRYDDTFPFTLQYDGQDEKQVYWKAAYGVDIWTSPSGQGSTRKEAVANLLLALGQEQWVQGSSNA